MNAFEVLGIVSSATDKEIKGAYRRLAQINHPDKCGAPGATAALSAINVAYQWLTKGGRRAPNFDKDLVIFRSVQECEDAAKPKPRTTRIGKMGLKDLLRNDLEAAGLAGIRMSAYVAAGYTKAHFKTTVSDLRNPKYCGKGKSPLNIIRDGEWYFVC